MTATFTTKGDKLFIDGKEVLKAWESFSGWYWFGTEREQVQDSDFGNGKIVKGDQIWFGYVQGLEEEWGSFSEAELNSLYTNGRVWEIPAKNIPHSGRRNSGSQ